MVRLLLLWIAAFYAAPLYANASIKSVDTLGEYIFGPQVSQAEACKRAEARAREQAIRRTFGEVYFSEQSLGCSEKTNSECEYARVSVSHLNGYILDFKNRKERVSDQGGLRVCRVSGLAVLDTSKRSDPALFFDITLNRHVYRHGDELSAKVMVNALSHVAIFSQAELSQEKVVRLYPNRHDPEGLIDGKVIIPSADAKFRFLVSLVDKTRSGLEIERDKPHRDETETTVEYLYVVRTKERVNWLESYSPAELHRHLALIEPRSRFVRVIPYRVIR